MSDLENEVDQVEVQSRELADHLRVLYHKLNKYKHLVNHLEHSREWIRGQLERKILEKLEGSKQTVEVSEFEGLGGKKLIHAEQYITLSNNGEQVGLVLPFQYRAFLIKDGGAYLDIVRQVLESEAYTVKKMPVSMESFKTLRSDGLDFIKSLKVKS